MGHTSSLLGSEDGNNKDGEDGEEIKHDNNNDDKDETCDSMAHIKIAKQPHAPIVAITEVVELFHTLDLISSICWYVHQNGEDGTNTRTGCFYYNPMALPIKFSTIDIWTSLQLTLPPFNEFYEDETSTIYC
ncbi:hypothetical protein BS47DRAFT_1395058 [Hydnum rufescens UP504]|uniref:Uncharacterized protein n=1 Tax=Hydnum rufescens UP504 TaxID=1448309 RepID=A0A9P6ATI6_9AGAM|nr:hypothetical protein BS47DRAFT_1395058 [Hydnum rufescens UP504]